MLSIENTWKCSTFASVLKQSKSVNTWNTTGKFLSVQVLNIFKCWTNRVNSIVEPVQNKKIIIFSLNHTLLGSATFCSTTFGSATFGSAIFGIATFGSTAFGSPTFGSETLGSATFSSATFYICNIW